MEHIVNIIQKSWLTHDVLHLRLSRPGTFTFTAGQAIEATIDDDRFKGKMNPFTLTGLNTDEYLELIFKVYADHNGMTLAISKLQEGNSLVITDPWDTFKYSGPGVFIAGGTGITPFLAILRQLNAEGRVTGSKLLFSNKTEKDVFLYDELSQMLGTDFINILTREKKSHYIFGRINQEFLKKHITNYNQPFYACGPDPFAEQIRDMLVEIGINKDRIDIGY